MKRILIASTLTVALAGISMPWAASGQTAPAPDPKIGTRVTITGCLHKGTSWNSYVLLGVTERPADSAASLQVVPYAIYWLDSTDGLKEHVGDMVDITGKVTGRRPNPGTITFNVDPDETRETKVTVASNSKSKSETTKKFDNGPQAAGSSTEPSSVQVSRPVYKLDVQKIVALTVPAGSPACR